MNVTSVNPLKTRLARLMGLNVLIGIVIALILWRFDAGRSHHGLPAEILASLIHSIIYGLMFGLTMPYLAERLAIIRSPWNWASIVGALGLIAVLGSLLVQFCLLITNLIRANGFWPGFGYKTVSVFVVALIIGLSVHTYARVRDQAQANNLQLRTQELEKARALKLDTEARLASLESRLHPHFLFNTLNSISALIQEDPVLADRMVQRLASLLRAALNASAQSRVALKEDLELATDYLEIERARFRERLSYSVELGAGLESLAVPPLTLQPLVENSVKFAVLPRPEGGKIRISANRVADGLALEVWDDGPGFSKEMIPGGHGLDNLQARLVVQFGPKAQLLIDSVKASTAVTVLLPIEYVQTGLRQ